MGQYKVGDKIAYNVGRERSRWAVAVVVAMKSRGRFTDSLGHTWRANGFSNVCGHRAAFAYHYNEVADVVEATEAKFRRNKRAQHVCKVALVKLAGLSPSSASDEELRLLARFAGIAMEDNNDPTLGTMSGTGG